MQVLKSVVAQLQTLGEPSRIIEVAYKYIQISKGKAEDTAKAVTIVMTVPKTETPKQIADKKAMLSALAVPQFCHCAALALYMIYD